MYKRKLTFATAQRVRQLHREHGWGKVKICNILRKEGHDITQNAIGNILEGRTYRTRLALSGNSRVTTDQVKIIRNQHRLGRTNEWISCWLAVQGIKLTAKGIDDIIKYRTWKEVP